MKIVSTTSTVLPPTNTGAVGKAWDQVRQASIGSADAGVQATGR